MSAVVTRGLPFLSRNSEKIVSCTFFQFRPINRGTFVTRRKPLSKQRKAWSAVQTLQLVSTIERHARKPVLEMCQRLQDSGYEFDDVVSHWDEVSSLSVWEMTWLTHGLLVERKLLTIKNLLAAQKEPTVCPIEKALPFKMTRNQCIDVLSNMLLNSGANTELVAELTDKLFNYELRDLQFVNECTDSIGVARLLIVYLNVNPNSVISEYSCLCLIDFALFIEQWQDMKAFGLKLPSEVVNFLTGKYIKPCHREAKSYSTMDVLKLMGLSRQQADAIGFTKEAILYILDKVNLATIENTYNNLLKIGYTHKDIAASPFILAFTLQQIKALQEEKPKEFIAKFDATTEKREKLNLLVKYLNVMYRRKIDVFFKTQYINNIVDEMG